MTPRLRNRVRSYATAVVVALVCVLLGGLRNTLAVVAFLGVVWLLCYYLPLVIAIKRARRRQ